MWEAYGADVQFYIVYIREAHPVDGDFPLGDDNYVIVEDPVTLAERESVARTCLSKLALEPIPALVDDMADTVNVAYNAGPDRLYLVARDGTIAYRGGPGPFGFHPHELEAAIRTEMGLVALDPDVEED